MITVLFGSKSKGVALNTRGLVQVNTSQREDDQRSEGHQL